jgi:hypothetical protein
MEQHEQPYSVKEAIAERIIEAAVEIINEPRRQDVILDNLSYIYESTYDMVTPDLVILDFVNEIRKRMTAYGWDSRLVLKVSFTKLSNTFNRATVNMDLDATLERSKPAKKVRKVKVEKAIDIVSDNPSPDTINEFLNTVECQSQRRTPLLSDRSPGFVIDPEGRGFRSSYGDSL